METALLELLKATPIGGAMIVLVVIFLKAIERRDERFDTITKGVIESNTRSLKENTEVLAGCKFVQQLRDTEK